MLGVLIRGERERKDMEGILCRKCGYARTMLGFGVVTRRAN